MDRRRVSVTMQEHIGLLVPHGGSDERLMQRLMRRQRVLVGALFAVGLTLMIVNYLPDALRWMGRSPGPPHNVIAIAASVVGWLVFAAVAWLMAQPQFYADLAWVRRLLRAADATANSPGQEDRRSVMRTIMADRRRRRRMYDRTLYLAVVEPSSGAAILVPLTAVLIGLSMSHKHGIPLAMIVYGWLGLLLVIAALQVRLIWRFQAARRLLSARICPECRYPLPDCQGSHSAPPRCAECGASLARWHLLV